MKNRSKSSVAVAIIVICMIAGLTIGVLAHNCTAQNWYCVHRKDHKQPSADLQFDFIEEYNGYYVDKAHGDDCVEKVVYLTFDAGYENGNVEKILDVLKAKQIPAAFFVLGNLVERNTDLILRMQKEGHLVCNHTYSHKAMVGKSREEFEVELKRLEEICLEKTGKPIDKYYRPPEGKFDEASLQYASEMGYKTVFWSFAYADWDNQAQMPTEKAKQKILENLHNGEVILLHPTSSTNAAVLADVIDSILASGYRFGTLDQLCKEAEM